MSVTIKLRRGTAAQWQAINPVLDLGEPGVERETRRVKYGDGVTAWNDLQYSGSGEGGGEGGASGTILVANITWLMTHNLPFQPVAFKYRNQLGEEIEPESEEWINDTQVVATWPTPERGTWKAS